MASASAVEMLEVENRWAELENYTITVTAERDELKAEVQQLRKSAQILAAESSSAKAAVVDHEELKKLRAGLSASQKDGELRLRELLEAREEIAQVTTELQSKVSEAAQLTGDLQELHSRATTAELRLAPVQAELETCKQERAAAEATVKRLENDLSELVRQRSLFFAESSEQVKKLAADNLELRQATAAAQTKAAEAEKLREEAQQEVTKLKLRLEEMTSTYDDERLASETYREARDDEGKNMTKKLGEGELRLKVLSEDLEGYKKDKLLLESEVKTLKQQLASAEEASKATSIRQLEAAGALLSGENVSGAGVGVVGSTTIASLGTSTLAFTPDLPKLIQDLTAARQQALTEKQARQQIEESLKDLEEQMRVKLPLLAEQKRQLTAFKTENAKLIERTEEMRIALCDADLLAKQAIAAATKAKRSEELLEKHARDMATELGAVLQAASEGTSPESFISNLAEQNESLRKSVARLTDDCETTAQAELKELKQEHERLLVQWKKQLGDKDAQVAALSEQLRLLAQDKLGQESSFSLRTLSGDSAGASVASGSGVEGGNLAQEASPNSPLPLTAVQAKPKEVELQEQLTHVRNDFSRVVEVLHQEIKSLRESELTARRESAEARSRLAAELGRGREAVRNAARAASRLKVQSLHLKAVEARGKSAQQRLRNDEEEVKKLQTELSQAQRERLHAEKRLRQEQTKAAAMEESTAKLMGERASYMQVMIQLQTRIAEQGSDYQKAKLTLEEGLKKKAQQIQEEVEISKRQQEGLRKSVGELSASLSSRSEEVGEARQRVSELEDTVKTLQEKLTEREAEVQELRATGAARPKREADIAAAALTRSKKRSAEEMSGGAEQNSRAMALEKELKALKQREAQQRSSVELWKGMLAGHEEEVKKQQLEVKAHQEQISKQQEECDKIKAELEKSKEEAAKQEEKLQEAKTAAAKLEQALKESRSEVQELERKAKEARMPDSAEEWRNKHREVVQEIASYAAKLDAALEEKQALEFEKADLEQQKSDLTSQLEKAKSERRPAAIYPESTAAIPELEGSSDEVQLKLRRLVAEKNMLEAESRTLRSDQRQLQERLARQAVELQEAKRGEQLGKQALARLARLQTHLPAVQESTTVGRKEGPPQPVKAAPPPTEQPSSAPSSSTTTAATTAAAATTTAATPAPAASAPPAAPPAATTSAATTTTTQSVGSDKDRAKAQIDNAVDLQKRLTVRCKETASTPERDNEILQESKSSLSYLLNALRQAENLKKLHMARINALEKKIPKEKS